MFRQSLFTLLFIFLSFLAVSQNPGGYYNSASGHKGEELKTELHKIIRNHTVLDYGSLWGIFPETDARPDGTIWDMYSNNIRLFGSTQGLNREHSFPVSWWGGSNQLPIYTDLNHIFPSDETANMAKSNHPLGVVGANPDFDNGLVKVGQSVFPGYSGTVFEPADQYKGDFARTYLYIATRYQDYYSRWTNLNMLDLNTYPVFKPWGLELLLKWHREHPVSQKELERNEAVYRNQGNRNPFIDFPELVDHIWGKEEWVNEEDWQDWVIDTSDTEQTLMTPVNNYNLHFGTAVTGETKTLTLFVKGTNLTGNLSILLNDPDGLFTIHHNSISFQGNNTYMVSSGLVNSEEGLPLQVTFNPFIFTGDHNATIIIYDYDDNLSSRKVNIHANSIYPESIDPPTALAASAVTENSFIANWEDDGASESYIVTLFSNNDVTKLVYIEDNLLGSSTEFIGLDNDKSYSYQVHRVVGGLISAPSEMVNTHTLVGIFQPEASQQFNVWNQNRTIFIENQSALNQHIQVYSISGVIILNETLLPGIKEISVTTPGIYIISVNGDVKKVLVR